VLKFNRETRQTFPLIQVRQVFRVSGPAAPGRKESSESVISSEKTQHAARSGQRLAALPCFAPREDQESSDQLSINSSKTITTCHFLAVAFQFINNQPFKIKHSPLAFSSLPLHDSRSLSCKQRPARFVTRKQQRNLLCAESLVSGQVLTLRPKPHISYCQEMEKPRSSERCRNQENQRLKCPRDSKPRLVLSISS
jgi:hypothetical protein